MSSRIEADLLHAMETAERNAWSSLARYKFWMFGYHAAAWVKLNRLLPERRRNPFASLVVFARERGKRAA